MAYHKSYAGGVDKADNSDPLGIARLINDIGSQLHIGNVTININSYGPQTTHNLSQMDSRGIFGLPCLPNTSALGPTYAQPSYNELPNYQPPGSSYCHPSTAPGGMPGCSPTAGGQPHGTMTAVVLNFQLAGCRNAGGTYEIKFNFPTITYKAYVQYTDRGKLVVRLLEQALNNRVLFRMGPEGQMTWNGVYLITDRRQRALRGYLPAVIAALAALGVY